jgi:hypothetical protein
VTAPVAPTDTAGTEQAGAAMAQAQTQALIENAQRLGLIWLRRMATISSADFGAVTGVLDGDSEAIAMTSMVGPVYAGQRVYVDIVPPAGNFIVGTANAQQIGIRARDTTPQTVANAAQTTLSYNIIDEEVGGQFGSTPLTNVTIPVTGLWDITVRTSLFAAGGARNFLNIAITTAIANAPSGFRSSFVAGESTSSLTVSSIPLLAGDTFNTSIYQEGGANTVSAWLYAFRTSGYTP